MIVTMKELPPRREQDHYPTPPWLAEKALQLIREPPATILDPGAGNGVWGRAARRRWPDAYIQAIEIRPMPIESTLGYDSCLCNDYLEDSREPQPEPADLICGNPPYRLIEPFIRRSLELLNRHGEILFLARLAFLAGQKRRDGLFREHPPRTVAVCSKRPGFNAGNNRTNATDFAVLLWQKGWSGRTEVDWL